MKLRDWHTKEFEVKLDNHFVELITREDPLRQAGFQSLEEFYSQQAVTEDRYLAVLQKVAVWLVQQPTNGPLQAPVP